MAGAARSGPSEASGPREARDARIPCPLCGGLIHPIAGRCKHCKADLSAYRAARPAASAPLPALQPSTTTGNGASGPIAHAVAMPPAAQAILPPGPRAPTGQPAGSAWRSWPMVVIVVAMMAIVAAVVLMVWPTSHGEAGKPLPPPPAPERMNTQTPPITPKIDTRPAPGRAPADPSGGPHASAPSAPAAPAGPAGADSGDDPSPADPVASDDDPAADDAVGSPAPPPAPPRRGHRTLSLNAGGMLQVTMAARLCRKLVQCGTTDATMKTMCEQIASLGISSAPPASCPAAARCLRHIDLMGCTSQPDALQLGMLMMQFSDCVSAMRC